MLHVPQFLATVAPPPPADPLHRPLTPAGYLALRRKASGRSVDQAGARIVGSCRTRRGRRDGLAASLARLRDLLNLAERPGTVVRDRATLMLIRRGYDFDPDVYRQLATEPADRHPRICRECGCSQHDPCECDDGGTCGWAGAQICTRCLAPEGR